MLCLSVVATLQVLFSFVWMPGVAALCPVYCADGQSAPDTSGHWGTAARDQAADASNNSSLAHPFNRNSHLLLYLVLDYAICVHIFVGDDAGFID